MTHPGSEEKARRIADYVTAAFSAIGREYQSISDIKAAVRERYSEKIS